MGPTQTTPMSDSSAFYAAPVYALSNASGLATGVLIELFIQHSVMLLEFEALKCLEL